MKKLQREILAKVLEYLEPIGGTARMEPPLNSKHGKIHITYKGKTVSLPVACSPKLPQFAAQHKLNDVKKLIRNWQS